MTAFSTLNVLPPAQLTNLNELGYLTMTPVQAAALPAILAGKDVRVQAKTGSGKTAAFGLGLLQQILPGARVNILFGIAGCDAGRVLSGLHKSSPIRLRIGRYPGYFTSTTFSRNSSN